MRVLLAAPSSPERLHTLMPWAWALRTGGHEAQIAVRPDFVETTTATGFVAVPVGPEGADGALLDLAEDTAGLVDHASRWRPDLLIWDGAAPAAAEAAAECGAFGVAALGPYEHPAQPGADATYDCLPPALRGPKAEVDGERMGVRQVPYEGSVELPSWLGRKVRHPRVLVVGDLAPEAVGGLFAGSAGLRVELLCQLSQDRVPAGVRLPAHTRLLDSLPVLATLPTCTAVVHDGTAEVTMAAAGLGLPQLIVQDPGRPVSAVAGRVAEQGAGLLTASDGLEAALPALFAEPGPGEQAAQLAEEIAELPTPRTAVVELAKRVSAR